LTNENNLNKGWAENGRKLIVEINNLMAGNLENLISTECLSIICFCVLKIF
jgi:hypothetical protein